VGWFSHENPFAMDIRDFRYAEDAMRFFGGTPSPAPFAAALSAHKLLDKSGIQSAHTHVQSILDTLVSGLDDKVLVSPRKATQRGATLVIAPKNQQHLIQKLNTVKILFDERAEGLRFSFHHYTPLDDVRHLENSLTQL